MVKRSTEEIRAERFASIATEYGASHGERDGAVADRYLMVEGTEHGPRKLTSHASLAAALRVVNDSPEDAAPPLLFVDLDTGAQWDPVCEWSVQPRAGQEPRIEACDQNGLRFAVIVFVTAKGWRLEDKHGNTFQRDPSGDGGAMLGFKDVDDHEPIAVRRDDWIAVGGAS